MCYKRYKNMVIKISINLIIIGVLVSRNLDVYNAEEYPSDYGPKLCSDDPTMPEFDFIVCGAGSAGSAITGRLTEEPTWKVLLLERGQDPNKDSEIPLLWSRLLRSPYDYAYLTETDEHLFKGMENKRSYIPRGHMTGGSSSMNVMVYTRGTKEDYESWKEAGCDAWGYPDVLPFFLKSEGYQTNSTMNTKYHNIGGPLSVTRYFAPDPAITTFKNGLKEIGLEDIGDLNGDKPLGFASADSTTINGLRCSAAKAFLRPARLRNNLYFARNTLVKKVIIDKESKTATGVEVLAPNGKTCIINASKEVIVSAGAVASPQVLMLSGVGPQDHLNEMGIELIADLPAGEHFHDHPCYMGIVFTDRKNRSPEEIQAESSQLLQKTMEAINRGISTMGLTELITFINTKGNSDTHRDVEIMKMRIPYKSMKQSWNGKHKLYNMAAFDVETADLFTKLNEKSDLIFFMPILLDIKSFGRIKLNSTNPEEHPIIVSNLMKQPEELKMMLEAVHLAQKLAETTAFKEAGLVMERVNFKACEDFEMADDEYWKCGFNQVLTGFYHLGGSVRMGSEGDPTSVVNPKLKVKTIKNFRVCDASIMPLSISGNTNAATIMIGERCAHFIKEEYGKKTDNYEGLL